MRVGVGINDRVRQSARSRDEGGKNAEAFRLLHFSINLSRLQAAHQAKVL